MSEGPILHIYKNGRKTELHTDALVNKGTAKFCYKKPKMESYTPFTTCRRRQIQQKKRQHFKIVTDCSTFQKTMQKKDLITRIARWVLQLEEFDYEIEHRAGSRMKHVDALSRYPVMIRILNSTICRSTKWTPFELLVGTKMRNKEDILIKDLLLEEMAKELLEQREFLRNDAKKNIETLQSENRKTYNRRRKKASLYKEGDLVVIQRTQFGAGLKLRPKF
ncbi:retrovirus-related Pol polyprotein from transposon 17.6 [Trichonephila clavipes]|nr:retrovirus-related Pol polyprotein from transposon 17.6 [Trichonephila clavipes]